MSEPIIIDMGRLEDWPISHLRRACQKNKVKGYSTMSRDELVQAVRGILAKFKSDKSEDKPHQGSPCANELERNK